MFHVQRVCAPVIFKGISVLVSTGGTGSRRVCPLRVSRCCCALPPAHRAHSLLWCVSRRTQARAAAASLDLTSSPEPYRLLVPRTSTDTARPYHCPPHPPLSQPFSHPPVGTSSYRFTVLSYHGPIREYHWLRVHGTAGYASETQASQLFPRGGASRFRGDEGRMGHLGQPSGCECERFCALYTVVQEHLRA